MALSQDECTEIYAEVAELMSNTGLGWILSEVADAIAVGKVTTIRVNRKKKPHRNPEGQPLFEVPAQPVEDDKGTTELTAVDYSPSERLRLLLQALAQYVHDVNDIISGLPGTEIRSESQVDIRTPAFMTESGDLVMAISPDMERPDITFYDRLQAIIADL